MYCTVALLKGSLIKWVGGIQSFHMQVYSEYGEDITCIHYIVSVHVYII